MIKAHEPFQDGSSHAANEYCPTCHGNMDRNLWDAEGMYRPDVQQRTAARAHAPYGEWCRNPDACRGKGYCPLDPTCGD